MSEKLWTEGVCGGGAVFLKDGVPQTISEVLDALNYTPTPPEPTDENPSASISSRRTDKSEPSAEAVEAVARAIFDEDTLIPDRWGNLPEEARECFRRQARAALAADPLRRELGEAMQLLMDIKEWDVDGWKERDTLMALPLELRQRLAALLEKHA